MIDLESFKWFSLFDSIFEVSIQCHYSDEPYICNYVTFIDSLIHTKDDVELLVEKEVIYQQTFQK